MSKPDKKMLARVRKLCAKFDADMQGLFDEMDEATYETTACQNAVSAQGYAHDAAEETE